MKNSIKQIVIRYLEENYGPKFEWSGKICRAIHELTGTKEAIVERRMRELARDGVLEVVREQVDGKGPYCTRYRLNPWSEKNIHVYNTKDVSVAIPKDFLKLKQTKLL